MAKLPVLLIFSRLLSRSLPRYHQGRGLSALGANGIHRREAAGGCLLFLPKTSWSACNKMHLSFRTRSPGFPEPQGFVATAGSASICPIGRPAIPGHGPHNPRAGWSRYDIRSKGREGTIVLFRLARPPTELRPKSQNRSRRSAKATGRQNLTKSFYPAEFSANFRTSLNEFPYGEA